jgi:putative ABC transport system permease protein
VGSSVRPRAPRLTRLSTPPVSSPPASASPQTKSLESLLQEFRSRDYHRSSIFGAILASALEAVWANRMRSILTMLGIVIGIAAVIGSITLTSGIGAYATNVIAGYGTNTVTVEPLSSTNRNASTRGVAVRNLSQEDLLDITNLPYVTAISPADSVQEQVVYGDKNWKTTIVGASPALENIQNWGLSYGIWFSDAQSNGGKAVAILGDTVLQKLFGSDDVNPVGKQIRIGNQLFLVVGALAPKGEGIGTSDDEIIVPYKAEQARLSNSIYFKQIIVSADSQNDVNLVTQEITATLERNHHIARGSPDDFQFVTSQQLLQQSNQETAAISLLLTGIAAISLTVGGIGIMNIMLVSVTERTREIGIRMAVGAPRGAIRAQFLIEALLLCVVGGLIGLLLGVLLGWGMVAIVAAGVSGGKNGVVHVPVVVTPTTVLLPVIVSVSVGLVFGFYPAVRASKLDPIVALRRAR